MTWNTAGQPGPAGETGPAGPQGEKGDPGTDAPAITAGSDRGPSGSPPQPANLQSTPTPLTTDNLATGFPGYLVWADVALQFANGNPNNGTMPSPSSAGCAIVYSVNGRVGTHVVDSRGVSFPVFTFTTPDKIVQLTVGLNGLIGQDLVPALDPSETVNVTLQCNQNPGPNPPAGQIPVKATSWSISGLGASKPFTE